MAGGVGVLGGSQRQQQRRGHRTGTRRGQLSRKASQRKYAQVKAEDMFRSDRKVIKMNLWWWVF